MPDVLPQSYLDRLDAGIGFRWKDLPPRVFSVADAEVAGGTLCFGRLRRSHRGLGACTGIRTLLAYDVDQGFVEEIAGLGELQTLYLQRVTATHLEPLGRLRGLRRLVIDSPTRIGSLDFVRHLPATLEALAIGNARRVHALDAVAGLTHLRTLAVEGSLHTSMRVASLAPLSALTQLEWLFLTALRVEDRRLAPLAPLARLRVLEFADYYGAGEIDALARALPSVRCSWFEAGSQKHRWEIRGLGRGA